MDEYLPRLAERLRIPDADIVSVDETADWPEGKLDELVAAGILAEIEPSRSVVCDQCEENCPIEPENRTSPDGQTTGYFVCTRNPDIGRMEIDLNRLRRWKINRQHPDIVRLLKEPVRRRKRKVSSELTPKESEAFQLVQINGKTAKQAAIEMRCSPQRISQLLKKAGVKLDARKSRSINFDKTQALPTDRRGQVDITDRDEDNESTGL